MNCVAVSNALDLHEEILDLEKVLTKTEGKLQYLLVLNNLINPIYFTSSLTIFGWQQLFPTCRDVAAAAVPAVTT